MAVVNEKSFVKIKEYKKRNFSSREIAALTGFGRETIRKVCNAVDWEAFVEEKKRTQELRKERAEIKKKEEKAKTINREEIELLVECLIARISKEMSDSLETIKAKLLWEAGGLWVNKNDDL